MKITLLQGAQRYEIAAARLQKALRQGRLPGRKILGRWSLDTEELDPLLLNNKETTKND